MKTIISVIKSILQGLLDLLPIIILLSAIITPLLMLPDKILELIIWLIVLLALIILIPVFKKYENNTKKRKQQIKENDRVIIENFLKKEYTTFISTKKEEYDLNNDDYLYIYDEIEQVEGLCFALLSAQATTQEKKYVLSKEFDKLIISINIKELNKIYEESKEIKKIIYKYYNADGKWKIKEKLDKNG